MFLQYPNRLIPFSLFCQLYVCLETSGKYRLSCSMQKHAMKLRIRSRESTVTQEARIGLGLKQLLRLSRLRAIQISVMNAKA